MSRLAPYENWNALRDEARRIWDIYRTVTIYDRRAEEVTLDEVERVLI